MLSKVQLLPSWHLQPAAVKRHGACQWQLPEGAERTLNTIPCRMVLQQLQAAGKPEERQRSGHGNTFAPAGSAAQRKATSCRRQRCSAGAGAAGLDTPHLRETHLMIAGLELQVEER